MKKLFKVGSVIFEVAIINKKSKTGKGKERFYFDVTPVGKKAISTFSMRSKYASRVHFESV